MAVPDYQSMMLPILRVAGDSKEQLFGDVVETVSTHFNLTPEERKQLLPSGSQTTFENRAGWAITYLKKAGLLTSTGRARFRITERGLNVLRQNPSKINVTFLRQFPEFVEFKRISRRAESDRKIEDDALEMTDVQTPEERFETSHQNLRETLAQELLERVKKCSPSFFEKLVIDLLVAMGYGGSREDAGQAVGRTGDEGIDGVIKEDKLGLDVVYVQAKRWNSSVGSEVVRTFAGSLEGQRARKGILITTSQFAQSARDYVNKIEKKIVLIDGEQLAKLMIDYGVGTSEVATYRIKKIDSDYFDQE